MSNKKLLFKDFNTQRWTFSNIENSLVEKISNSLNIDKLIAKTLIHNLKTTDKDKLLNTIHPDKNLHYELTDFVPEEQLKNAVKRIREAQSKTEIVFVNGDPDADGIGGTSILVAGLRQLGLETHYKFPIRPTEGHGLQIRIIEQAHEMGAKLIFTADCGTKDIASVEYAKKKGIDVIITDHHILGHTLPKALAIINPYLIKKKTLFHQVAGSTVAYKFIQAVFKEMNKDFPDFLFEFGCIVSALGSISDRVSLQNPLNRLIINDGVEFYKHSDREGIKTLRKLSDRHHLMIKARHLSRTVVPRLNAPGRIGNPEQNIPDAGIVVDLFLLGRGKRNKKKAEAVKKVFKSILSIDNELKKKQQESNEADVFQVAVDVNNINEKRKYITAKIHDEMESLVESQVNIEEDKVIIIEGKNWNSGVIGIDTDRIKERFLRPAIILTSQEDNHYLRGSCRSIPGINMYKIIDETEQLFQKKYNRMLFCNLIKNKKDKKETLISAFGGHAQACGFTLHKDDKEVFKKIIREKMEAVPHENFEYHYNIIDKIKYSKISTKFIEELDKYGPYGQEYNFPIFYLESVTIKKGTVFGNKYQTNVKNHVRFLINSTDTNNTTTYQAIGFNLWEKYCYIKENAPKDASFDLIFTLEIDPKIKSEKPNQSHIRLNTLDIRINNTSK